MFLYYTAQNLFFAELLHKLVYIDDSPYFLLPILALILLWLISKNIFKGKLTSLIPSIVFIISPWGWYLASAHSLYLFLLILVLTFIYGIILTKSGRIYAGNLFIILASAMGIYTSPIMLIIIPTGFVILLISKIINFKRVEISSVFLVLLSLPILFLINKDKFGFKNIISNEVKTFSDPSLLNSVNRYQGAANDIGFKTASRISENKYLFFAEYSLLKYFTQFMPETIFTSNYRLLGFSFSPPILVGFVIPFIYGLYLSIQKPDLRKVLFVSTFLVVPSLLSHDIVSLNRLVLFSPVIIILISYGLVSLYDKGKINIARNFLMLTIILVFFQLVVTLGDIKYRENMRLEAYLGKKYEMVEP